MSEEVEVDAPKILRELENFISLNPMMDDKPESLIYAIAQLLQDNIADYEASPEIKGATVQSIIDGLREINRFDIALFREHLKTLSSQKASTIH